jgi:microcystin-dependent protein
MRKTLFAVGVLCFLASPALAGSDAYIGEVQAFAFNRYCPEDWLPADGRTLSIQDNQALYSLIGEAYGGDGRRTFALPDLRGAGPETTGEKRGLKMHWCISMRGNYPPHPH